MKKFNTSSPNIQVKLTSADLAGTLKLLADMGIILYNIHYHDDLSAYVTVKSNEVKRMQSILHRCGVQLTLHGTQNRQSFLHVIKKRCVMLMGLLALFSLTVYIPSRVFFIQIKGNEKISSQYITQKAVENGITFGCNRWSIRSAQLKNQLLEDIPELDWVGVTTAGCVATVEVKEKRLPKAVSEPKFGSIISAVDGLVESVTVTKGKALCIPGQAVREGQLLISGYVDQGFVIKAVGAEGEIYAKTYRKLEAVSPISCTYRSAAKGSTVKYALQIGKKVINFSKHSSISPIRCVKIYTRKYLTFPGGYILPIALIREENICYETYDNTFTPDNFTWMEAAAAKYVQQQMIAGEITAHTFRYDADEALCYYAGAYVCREQIGKYKFEENPLYYGENS